MGGSPVVILKPAWVLSEISEENLLWGGEKSGLDDLYVSLPTPMIL